MSIGNNDCVIGHFEFLTKINYPLGVGQFLILDHIDGEALGSCVAFDGIQGGQELIDDAVINGK
ncbi:hypothetical protein COSHB9_06940 [Companilactobacillus alimentarius]|nr:hypothetical protein LAL01_13220 [Companilactobacillus alimentarius]